MCFYNDPDWYASPVTDELRTATAPLTCMECRSPIPIDAQYRYVYQQEHECCRCLDFERCLDDDATIEARGDTCTCPTPDYGETYHYHRCLDCDKFLSAVAAVEHDAGCPSDESQPCYEGMIEEISEGHGYGDESAVRYFKRANRDYPELKRSGYLKRIAERVFVR